jgi:heme o synthase
MSAPKASAAVASVQAAPANSAHRERRSFLAYLTLIKPRVISLLLVTTVGAMALAAHGVPPWHLVLFTLIGGTLGAGGANAINQYLDRDIDQLMSRTNLRPVPAGLVDANRALRFGLLLAIASFLIFALFVNVLSGLLTLSALAYYVFVYTRWLKRSSVHNIVIGGAAGAIPPVVGWTAVTGEISLLAVFLFAIVFYWTPPHFWALSLLIKREYARARVPMLPVVRGEDETRHQIVLYTILMLAVTTVVYGLGLLGWIYLASAVVLGGIFLWYAVRLQREATSEAARSLFKYSILYLALLFAAMVVDRQVLV